MVGKVSDKNVRRLGHEELVVVRDMTTKLVSVEYPWLSDINGMRREGLDVSPRQMELL